MSLSTTQYGYIVDPMVPFTDDKGKTIKNGFIRVFMAETSTPVLTYRNYDGATNQEKIELDNSGRVRYNVIGYKNSLYKVVIYDAHHSQETPILTVDKIAVLGASVNAPGSTFVTGLDSVTFKEENFIKATVEGTAVELSLDPTEVTSEVSSIEDVETAAPNYVVPLLDKTGTEESKKISLANLFKFVLDWISRLATTVTSFASGDFIAVSNPTNGARKMAASQLMELTAQNALAGNVAPAFDPTKPNDAGGFAYYSGENVTYEGKNYVFSTNHYSGAWDASEVEQKPLSKSINLEGVGQAVQEWLDEHPEATTTVEDGSLTEDKFSEHLKIVSIKDYLTPQMFGAKGDGETDDTNAFRDMFSEAKRRAINGYGVFSGCQKVYIPSGVYIITSSIIDPDLGVAPAAFEVFGAGRENTIIDFSGNVLFDDYNVFAYTTFHDIGFVGNQENIFLQMKDTSYGVQRINYISCRFTSWKTIVNTQTSSSNMSECTFLMCKINGCGTDEKKCDLFILDNPQIVNWRFIGTDIETFKGVVFDFLAGAAISISFASIIPLSSDSVVFRCVDYLTQNSFGQTNCPQITCYSARFELRDNSTMLDVRGFIRTEFDKGSVFSLVFVGTSFCLIGDLATTKFINAVGAFDMTCIACTGISGFNITYTSIASAYCNPKIIFRECLNEISIDAMRTNSSITLASIYQSRNAPHIIIDDNYDFIMASDSDGFIKSFVGNEHSVDFFNDSMGDVITLATSGSTKTRFVMGYVKEIDYYMVRGNIPASSTVTVEVYDSSDTLITTESVAMSSSPIHGSIDIYGYYDKIKIKVTHNYSGAVTIDLLFVAKVL